jgi:H+/gluconate symporter-like permease
MEGRILTALNLFSVLAADAPTEFSPTVPLIILAVGIAIVIGMIVVLRINAFLALITAAIVVSLLAPGEFAEKISRVATAFGSTAGKIGIVIALAAVIGKCLIDSGAADRIVRMFVRLLGEKRCPISLMSSGFVLSIPVFFDTVFYLLIPLARSMHRQTKRSYILLILAMGMGATITHSLVPPTPGPLIIAETLRIDLGMMIMIGLLCAAPTAMVMLFVISWFAKLVDIPMRPIEGSEPEPDPLPDEKLPSLLAAMLPIILPLVLISAHTVAKTLANAEHAARLTTDDVSSWQDFSATLAGSSGDTNTPEGTLFGLLPEETRQIASQGTTLSPEDQATLQADLNNLLGEPTTSLAEREAFAGLALSDEAQAWVKKAAGSTSRAEVERVNRLYLEQAFPNLIQSHVWETPRRQTTYITSVLGNANLAMMVSAAIALYVLWRQRKPSRVQLSKMVEHSLMSAGVIILITSGGGAFGAMLKQAQVGDAIQALLTGETTQQLGGIHLLLMGFLVAFLLKFAQGSTTVSMITTSAMMAGMIGTPEAIGYHPVYVAAAIGFGAQCGNWMNDSGFWVFAKMGGLTEIEGLKTWTFMVGVMTIVGLVFTILFATVLPLT